jgi:hypothetical protein
MKLTKSIKSTRTSPLRTLGSADLDAVVGGVIADEAPADTTGQASGKHQHEPVIVIKAH